MGMSRVALLYGAMSTNMLRALQRAFELDRARAVDAATRAFCDQRLAVIALELQARARDAETPSPDE